METSSIQNQIDEVNRKLDRVLEFVEIQNRKQEEMDDLMADINIVAKDAFRQSVVMLDKAGVELDSCGLSCLVIKLLQNIGTLHEMLEMMESARDFMKDVSPVLHQMGLDAVHKMNELDQKGYFELISSMGGMLDQWVRFLNEPRTREALDRTTHALMEIRMDDRMDDKSLWKIFLQLRSPEVRKSLSYSLRLIQAINPTKS